MSSKQFTLDRKTFVPALIGAGLCVFLLKSGILSLFFLVPLGFVAYRCDYKIAWLTVFSAFIGNLILVLIAAGAGTPFPLIILDLFYFAIMTFVFTWITAPPPDLSFNLPGPVRLVAGSCVAAIVFSFTFFKSMESEGFIEYIESFLGALISASRSSGIDVVQSAQLEMFSVDALVITIRSVMLRGGSLVSCALLFFICRQMSFLIASISQRMKGFAVQGRNLIFFHVYPQLIWVFSSSLLLVVFSKAVQINALEILLWNILIICAMLYLAQGLGIVQFFLSRPGTPGFMKMLFGVLFVILLFSPFVNMLLLGGIILLGVAENWVPLRAPKQTRPPSTPEAGDGSKDDPSIDGSS